MALHYVLVVSNDDPVAARVGAHWGVAESTGRHIDGAPLRRLAPHVGLLRRGGLHIHDDRLRIAPEDPHGPPPTLVFPSVHRSASGRPALTVHPLGNPTGANEVGGRPRTLVPTDARLMADALRRVAEVGESAGWSVSFEATHHGPHLEQPAFFVEIGAPEYAHPPEPLVAAFARLLPTLARAAEDRVALGLGGGHYAPHFTDLALERRWAFGHLLPRYVLADLRPETVEEARRLTPECVGSVYHRAEDLDEWARFAPPPRCREGEAAPRGPKAGPS